MSSFVPKRVLDIDFEFLDKLPIEYRLLALLELSEKFEGTWLETALELDAAENKSIVEDARRNSQTQDGPRTSSNFAHLDEDSSDWRKEYWEKIAPLVIKNDRRRASDYRIALRLLRKYYEELDQAGFDVYTDGSFTNILKLPKAIATQGYGPRVFRNAATMNTSTFATYAAGLEMPKEMPPTLKEYLDAINKR